MGRYGTASKERAVTRLSPPESFSHSLKVEAIHGERFTTREQLRQAVFGYIEVDYNRTRRHSANGLIRQCLHKGKSLAGIGDRAIGK